MGVNEQFITRHRRSQPFSGGSIRNLLKGAAKKGWQFLKNEGKNYGSKLFTTGKDLIEHELKTSGKDFVDKTGSKIRSGVKEIIKENAGPLAEGILKNPNATRELLQDSFRNATDKSKKLYNEIKNDTYAYASDQAGKIKDSGTVALSDALSSSRIGKKMKGKGNGSVEGELTKPKPQRKRLTTIVPVAMPMHGDGARYIGQQWGNGARVIGSQH